MKKSCSVQKSTKALKTAQGDVLQELRAMPRSTCLPR
jgi:hypothetical protein